MTEDLIPSGENSPGENSPGENSPGENTNNNAGQTPGENSPPVGEEFWDAENKTVKTDDLWKAFQQEQTRAKGLRDKLAKGYQNVPEKVEDYSFELAKESQEKMGDVKFNDTLVGLTKTAAKEAGLSKEQYNQFMASVIPQLHEISNQQQQTPEEIQAKADVWRESEKQKLGLNAQSIIDNTNTWLEGLNKIGTFSPEEYDLLRHGVGASAAGIRVLQKLRNLSTGDNQGSIRMNSPAEAPAEITKEELFKVVNNPDRGLDKKVDEEARKFIDRYNEQEERKKKKLT